MTSRRGFLGALAAFHCKLSGVDAASNYLGRSGAQPTVLNSHAEVLEAGNWAELSPAAHQTSVLIQSGESLSIYSNQVSWDQARKIGHFCGKRSNRFPIQHTVYRESTHDWITLHPDLSTPLGVFGHGYDYNIIDPATGRIFFKNFQVSRKIFYADPPDYVWSKDNALPLWPDPRHRNVPAMPCMFWSGPMSGVGSKGTIVLLVTASSPVPQSLHWVIYDVQTDAWERSVPIPGPHLSAFERWGDYSAIRNCAVAITGGASPNFGDTHAFRLNSDRTSTELTTPPRSAGGFSNGRSLGGNFVCDPVTGNFLLLAYDGTFWELDPSGSGTWTQLANAPAELWPVYKVGTICWAIPAYGVTAWATHKGEMWLYKHRLHSQVSRSSAKEISEFRNSPLPDRGNTHFSRHEHKGISYPLICPRRDASFDVIPA